MSCLLARIIGYTEISFFAAVSDSPSISVETWTSQQFENPAHVASKSKWRTLKLQYSVKSHRHFLSCLDTHVSRHNWLITSFAEGHRVTIRHGTTSKFYRFMGEQNRENYQTSFIQRVFFDCYFLYTNTQSSLNLLTVKPRRYTKSFNAALVDTSINILLLNWDSYL